MGRVVAKLKFMVGDGVKPIGGISIDPVTKISISLRVMVKAELSLLLIVIFPCSSNSAKNIAQNKAHSSSLALALEPCNENSIINRSCRVVGVTGLVWPLKRRLNTSGLLLRRVPIPTEFRPQNISSNSTLREYMQILLRIVSLILGSCCRRVCMRVIPKSTRKL